MKHVLNSDENKENIDKSDMEVHKKQIRKTRRRDTIKKQEDKNKEIAKETKSTKTLLSPKRCRNFEVDLNRRKYFNTES